ncbi:MAG: fatty acid desaturase [Verrucomicrobiae bacterium]|nr:fatty acid desaturase [Verrucomicrobiae bacterium]MCP5540238.1 fatty acid desaturase [Akkermansiaceae bacterium]MCP5551173.1 fatty acid desaturase [Akkermansiaceae bacterium]
MSESSNQAEGSLLDAATVREATRVRPFANLGALAIDYLVAIVATGGAVFFQIHHRDWGLHPAWIVPVWIAAAVVNGCVQHRIGLMGHEASHHLLVPNRRWNDILAELLCFYPVFGGLMQYRKKHLDHHLYPNDPDRDPNLGNGKAQRLYAKFPMPKRSFIYQYYVKFFWPPFVLANLLDLLDVITIGSGFSPAPVRDATPEEREKSGFASKLVRVRGTWLGILYLVAIVAALRLGYGHGWFWHIGGVGVLYVVALAVWAFLPESAFFRGARLSIPVKTAALLRLTYYTLLFAGLGAIRQVTGYDSSVAFIALWIFPLIYMFPYLMLLREVYQHANAGRGQIDNSRIILADPFTHWAVLGYGNDFHLIHHIYPNVPQYRLREVHERLVDESETYRDEVEVTRGIVKPRPSPAGDEPAVALLDSLAAKP